MLNLLALTSTINLVLNIISNIRLIVTLAVGGTLAFFGYLLYHNGMDIGLAYGEVESFWLSMWEWAKPVWGFVVSVWPF